MSAFPRVAFVAGTLGRGGAERQLYYMLRCMVEAGARPLVATLIEGEHWEARIRDLGVPVYWIGRSRNPAVRVRDLVTVLRRERPDVVQSVYFHTNLYAVAAARALRLPEIGAIRSDTRWAVKSLGHVGPASLRMPRHLAVNSLHALQQAADLGVRDDRLTLLPNVVDTEKFRPAPRPAGLRLLTVGRLVEIKRHDRFLRLVGRLHAARPDLDVRGTVVGEGPLELALRQLAKEMCIDGRVDFLRNPPMVGVYGSGNVLVLTSTSEGTPNVVLEAMSCAIPVVAFAVGGVPDLLSTLGSGVVVEPGDEAALLAAVLALADDPTWQAQMGRIARQSAQSQFSPSALEMYLSHLYRRVGCSNAAFPLVQTERGSAIS